MKQIVLLLPMGLLAFLLSSCGFSDSGIPEQRPSAESNYYDGSQATRPKKICLFFDGTANDHDSQTHIRHIYEMVSSRNNHQILCYYDSGVGAEVNQLSGMVGGGGFTQNLVQAYTFLSQNYRKGDRIYLFGYSRGARQAHIVSDIILRAGLPKFQLSLKRKDQNKYDAYSKAIISGYKQRWKTANKEILNPNSAEPKPASWLPEGHQKPIVDSLYLWDAVETFANNSWTMLGRSIKARGAVSYSRHYVYNYKIHPDIKECYHAMALDEKRGLYEVIPVIKPKNGSQTKIENVWFAGTHGDVGGSYDASEALAGCSLRWMLGKIKKKGLITIDIKNIGANPLGISVDSRHFLIPGKALGLIRKDRYRRQQLWGEFWSHYQKDSLANCPPKTFKPKIHRSVIRRLQAPSVSILRGKTVVPTGDTKLPYSAKIFKKPENAESIRYQSTCYHKGDTYVSNSQSNADVIRFIERKMHIVDDDE